MSRNLTHLPLCFSVLFRVRFLFCTDLTDNTDIFVRTRIFTECHGISVHLPPFNPRDPYSLLICIRVVPCISVFVFCSVRILRIIRIFLLEHRVSRSVTESLFICLRVVPCVSVFVFCSVRIIRIFCSNTDFHGVSRNLCSSVSV